MDAPLPGRSECPISAGRDESVLPLGRHPCPAPRLRDKETRTLSLFAFPSICANALQHGGAIFAFANHEGSPADPRANADDIRSLLKEVLLSYRLLLGQHAKSRKLLQRISGPADLPFEQPDTLLSVLYTAKSLDLEAGEGEEEVFPRDNPVYFAARHFPVLCERAAEAAILVDVEES